MLIFLILLRFTSGSFFCPFNCLPDCYQPSFFCQTSFDASLLLLPAFFCCQPSFVASLLLLPDFFCCQPSFVADLFVGLSLVTTSEIKNQVKIKEDCRKCNGSGKWVNPRNSADKRDCFTCKGTGKFSIGTSKNEAGKIQYNKITAGTEGTVVEWRSFGKFYANGYNKPDRSNTTVTLKRADGSLFNASLGKCKCARDYTLPSVLREKANEASYRYSFQDATGVRCAWLSTDYVYQVLAANKEKVA